MIRLNKAYVVGRLSALSKQFYDLRRLRFTQIPLSPGNRMIRIGVGQNNYVWFIRIDLWTTGIRLSKR